MLKSKYFSLMCTGNQFLAIFLYSLGLSTTSWGCDNCPHAESARQDVVPNFEGSYGPRFEAQRLLNLRSPRPKNDLAANLLPLVDVFTLHSSGDASNRVSLVFLSDGYTNSSKSKFLDDANRLALDLTGNQTFAPVLPLLNFYAVFVPSKESGIGVGGKLKDTAFGLYRDGTELRGVYPGNPEVIKEICYFLGPRCDYPIVLGNDPLYGGLGGDVSITTASILNGALVLRHELGHSIIDVGEEYDGGYAYFGANSSPLLNTSSGLKWSHWLTNKTSRDPSPLGREAYARTERAIMSLQAYPWTMLNHSSPFRSSFSSSGTYSRYLVRFSLSGIPEKDHLRVTLDRRDLGWTPRANVGVDRWHYDILIEHPLSAGAHELAFTLGKAANADIAQLCSVEIIEYGNSTEFNMAPGTVSAYPTFSLKNETTYRPTNEECLMRRVTYPNFCQPCLESLWLHLLKHVDLIDHLLVSRTANKLHATISLVPFGISRIAFTTLASEALLIAEESYTITWMRNGDAITSATNSTLLITERSESDVFHVNVQLHTRDVRNDPKGRLLASRMF